MLFWTYYNKGALLLAFIIITRLENNQTLCYCPGQKYSKMLVPSVSTQYLIGWTSSNDQGSLKYGYLLMLQR